MIYWVLRLAPLPGMVIGIDYAVGPLGAGMASLAGVLASAALVYCWRYFDSAHGRHHALVLIFLAASVDFCLTGDLFNLFVAFELVAVTAFALTGYNAGHPAPLQGAINFAVTNSLGGMSVLMGVGFLYARTGSLNLAQIGQALAGQHTDGLIVVAFALLTGGFLVKAAVVPFHFWLPDAYGSAPIPVCVLFAGVMSELGLFAVIRVWVTVFSGLAGGSGPRMRAVLLGLGILTAAGRGGHGAGPDPPQADAGLSHHEPPRHLPDRGWPADPAGPGRRVAAGDRRRPGQVRAVPRRRRRAASAGQRQRDQAARRRPRAGVTGVTIVLGRWSWPTCPPMCPRPGTRCWWTRRSGLACHGWKS
jgi:Formate hydrogenlyase subunit 3/Multisubunit Na+/H+ antiporter, MnhD subunit